ncbi:MAG: four-carbon acid sugar kinase family protein [Clostridiales bacterium]|nr:four-carbon acid sugar kinase family protein [Clostridiales bacterium]
MIQLLIIADDFTGALDTSVQLAAVGARTRVVIDMQTNASAIDSEVEVLVVDAETRHLSAEDAYKAIKNIVMEAKRLRVQHIFKKTDSALRGNIGAELTALLETSGETTLPFIPAFPQIGRITKGGIHYINDVPVAESVFGCDPFNPVLHSDISELIGEQSDIETFRATMEKPQTNQYGISIFDAVTQEELKQIGSVLLEKNGMPIMAGCAGFGAVLPEILGLKHSEPKKKIPLSDRLLVISGSINPITIAQLDRAEENGFQRYRLSLEQKLDYSWWQKETRDSFVYELQKELKEKRFVIIDSSEKNGKEEVADYASVHQMSLEEVRVRISQTMGKIVNLLFENDSQEMLFIIGGDTLMQCMAAIGVHEVEPVCEPIPGVVLSCFLYGGCNRYVFSKSGGFGGETLLTDLAKMISNHKEKEEV